MKIEGDAIPDTRRYFGYKQYYIVTSEGRRLYVIIPDYLLKDRHCNLRMALEWEETPQ